MRDGAGPKDAWEAALRKADAENGAYAALDEADRASAGEVLFLLSMRMGTREAMRREAQRRMQALEARAEEAKKTARDKAQVAQTLGMLVGAGLGVLLL